MSFRTIVTFALPYLLSYFLQTLYGMADLFIAGQFIGIDGITAVANGSQVLYMLTAVIVGLAMGATVTIGRAVGANRLDRAAKAIGNVITLFAGIALALTVLQKHATAMKYMGLFESPIPRNTELIMLYATMNGMPI